MIGKMLKKLKKDNSGAALVLVIVVISFVSITATILLYMSAMNFYMKTTDMKIKKSFYSGEKALEEVRASLMEDASKAFDKAYFNVMARYSMLDEASAQKELNTLFVTNFVNAWNTRINSTYPLAEGGSKADQLTSYISAIIDSNYSGSISVTAFPGTSETIKGVSANGTVTIGTVDLTYTDANDYTTTISTNFLVKAPKISFGGVGTGNVDYKLADCVVYTNWVKK